MERPKVKEALVIELLEGGGVSINGPIGNKMLCFGLLKVAEHLVANFKGDGGRVVVPSQIRAPFLGEGMKGPGGVPIR